MDILSINRNLAKAINLIIYDYELARAKRRANRYTRLTGLRSVVILTERKILGVKRILPIAIKLDSVPPYKRGLCIRKALYVAPRYTHHQ